MELSKNFDKVALYEILKNVRPWDVLNLCQVNKKFSEICKNEDIFSLLIKRYFPNFPISDNKSFKEQYINLVEKSPRYYTIKLNYNGGIERGEEANFYGFEIPRNLPNKYTWFQTDKNYDKEGYYWLAVSHDPEGSIYFTICKTFEQAIEECFINASEIISGINKNDMIKKLKKYGIYETYYGNGMNVFNQVVEIFIK